MKAAGRWIAGVLGIVMLITMGGCGKADAGESGEGLKPISSQQSENQDEDQDDYVYVPEYHILGQDCYYVTDPVFGEGDKVYYIGIDQDEESRLYSMDMKDFRQEDVPYALESGNKMGGLFRGKDGSLILILYQYKDDLKPGEEASPKKMFLQTISQDGTVQKTVDLSQIFASEADFYVSNLTLDDKGNYYIGSGKMLYVLDPEGKLQFEVPVGEYISSLFTLRTGEVVACYLTDTGWKVQQVDNSRQELKKLESNIKFSYGTYQEGEISDLLYTVDSKLYRYDRKDNAPVEVINWVDCNVESSYIKQVKMTQEERIAVITQNWSGSSDPELTVLTKKKRSEVPEKKVLVFGTYYVPYYTDSDVIAFNKQSKEYKVEIRRYGDENMEYKDRIALMNAEIASGKGPDMFDLNRVPYSLETMVSKGLLEDLTPYLEQDDSIKREDFVENVLKMYEKDGKLYGIAPSFEIQTLMGKVSDLGDKDTWTLEEMMKFADSKPEGVELIPNATKQSMLEILCSMNIGSFMNEETGVCDFKNEEFRRILEFADQFPPKEENSENVLARIKNGQALLLEERIGAVSAFQMFEFIFGDEVNFIGYPTSGSESGSYFRANGTAPGMNPASDNKEGVWEFISFILSKERQEQEVYTGGGFPSRKDLLEKQFAADMKPEYYVDADGSQKERSKSAWSIGDGDYTVDVYAATQEQVDRVKKMIETAVSGETGDGQVMNIISQEAQEYFTHTKSIEETVDVIQNRVQNYVNESR